ncbi:MAG TPA: hypothetical protein PLA74_05350 [Syntrophales bacterium]|nr:hypothetical protein [Syntrophales bacterium]HPQ44886.1 hypothetical protein [Syntrophales bacterium]
MTNDLDEKREMKKKAIFDGMSPRRREKILKKIGYEDWDPFQEPKDPIDLRDQRVEQSASLMCRRFLLDQDSVDCSAEYLKSVKEMCKGLIKAEEKYLAMYDFCCWYSKIYGK